MSPTSPVIVDTGSESRDDGTQAATTTAARAVIDVLRDHGVTHIFGLVGSSAMEIYDALYDEPDITYIGAKDERAATGMADGFARTAGRVGVVLAGQSGPGVTNLVSGLAAAKAARTPVVSIGGAVSTDHWQLDAFQEVDQESLLRPVTKAVLSAYRGNRVADTVRRALQMALNHPMGPVHVNIPRNVLAEAVPAFTEHVAVPSAPSAVDSAALERTAEVIAGAKRPVIVAGGGVKWARAGARVVELAAHLSAPIATSAGHRDAVSNDAPLFMGQMGARGSALANATIRQADVVIGIGTRFGFNSTFFDPDIFDPAAVIVQVDTDPLSLGRYVPQAQTVLSDPEAFCTAVLDRLATGARAQLDEPWLAAVTQSVADRAASRAVAPQPGDHLDPAAFFHTVRANIPRDAIVTLDAGTWCLKASEELDFYGSPSVLTPLDFASLGFGFPAAIGAQIAAPDRHAVAVIGDGGALFALSELATLNEYAVPATLLVMDNSAWGAEKAYQQDFYDSRFIGTDLPGQDMVKIAEGFGIVAHHAETVAELEAALRATFSRRAPAVINAKVDRSILHSFRKDIFDKR